MAFPENSLSQLAGCLAGQCLADALATPIRGSSAVMCQQYVGERVRHWLAGKSLDSLPDPLLYTDGSQLTCLLLSCLLDDESFQPRSFLSQLTTVLRRGWITQRYWETHLAVKRFTANGSRDADGRDSLGFGSVHRAAAPALRYWKHRELVREIAIKQSELTHPHSLCRAAAAFVADVIASVIRGDIGPGRLQMELAIPDSAIELGETLQRLPEILELDPQAAWNGILARTPSDKAEIMNDQLPDHLFPAILWSLYCVVQSDWDFEAAVCLAISGGGEIVGPAALAGALCGAYHGFDSLPSHLLQRLTDRGKSVLPQLKQLAERCHFAAGAQVSSLTS